MKPTSLRSMKPAILCLAHRTKDVNECQSVIGFCKRTLLQSSRVFWTFILCMHSLLRFGSQWRLLHDETYVTARNEAACGFASHTGYVWTVLYPMPAALKIFSRCNSQTYFELSSWCIHRLLRFGPQWRLLHDETYVTARNEAVCGFTSHTGYVWTVLYAMPAALKIFSRCNSQTYFELSSWCMHRLLRFGSQ